MKLKQIAAASAFALIGASAFATTCTGTCSSSNDQSVDFGVMGTVKQADSTTFTHRAGSFTDTITFSLDTLAGTKSASVSLDLLSLFKISPAATVSLFTSTGTSALASYTFGSTSTEFDFGNLAAGAYKLVFNGTATGSFGGVYATALSVTPVPEPQSIALMLAGLGLVGAVARRRKI